LRELGHEVDVLSPPGIDPFSESTSAPVDKSDVRTRGWATIWKSISRLCPQVLFEIAEIGYNLSLWIRMGRQLRRKRYDAVYERYAFFMVAGAYLAKRHNVVFLLEANELSGVKVRSRKQRLGKICRYFEQKLLSRCDSIFVVSSTLAKMAFERGVPSSKIHILPNAIDEAALTVDQERLTSIRAKYATDSDLIIGCIGWFDEWDRLDFLLSVFRLVAKSSTNVKLMLVGDGPSLTEMKSQVEKSALEEKITFVGAVERSDVFAFLSIFDIAILPHSNDYGSPVVLFELLGLGVPVVAPALPPIEDVVDHGATALLFEPLNIEKCADQLNKAIQSIELRSRLADAGRQLVCGNHTWVGNARRISDTIAAIRDGVVSA
jgi:glycosyltransferase involved in cell wall biosynthesis